MVVITNLCLRHREEGVDPLFEGSLYDCSPCIELIGGLVHVHFTLISCLLTLSFPLFQQSGLLQLLNQETLSPRYVAFLIKVSIDLT